MTRHARSVFFAFAVAALTAAGLCCSSGSPPSGCNPNSCATGCCDSTGTCQPGTSTSACGKSANTCSACSGAQVCQSGSCVTSSTGGGSGGGAAGGSGGGSGGGTAGGAGGGTAGGSGGGAGGGTAGGAGGGSGGGGSVIGAGDGGLTPDEKTLLLARPYRLVVPNGYDGGTAVPLVVLLHGYTATGQSQDLYFGFSALANSKTFILATPDGTIDTAGYHFWNATNACCNIYSSTVDDVKYLTALLDDIQLSYRVNPKRVYFVGHSNGAFMSHRMACDRADRVAAIVSLAGANWKDVSKCQPTAPVAVLQVHGTADLTIGYDGGVNYGNAYPGAGESVLDWATLNGCGTTLNPIGGTLDIDSNVFGSETARAKYTCTNGWAELWSIQGGGHVPGLTFPSTWGDDVWAFLSAHPKP